jgi:hypothetical protein
MIEEIWCVLIVPKSLCSTPIKKKRQILQGSQKKRFFSLPNHSATT